MINVVNIEELKGQTFDRVIMSEDNDQITFENEGVAYRMYHIQDCCESVLVEDILGDLDWLVGTPIVIAYAASHESLTGIDSETWTFYHLATLKGYVTIRWYGTSNGHYSEDVDIVKTIKDQQQ